MKNPAAIFFQFLIVVAVLALQILPLHAQDGEEPIPRSELEKPPTIDLDTPTEPAIPPKIQDEHIEPTVTIREEEDRRVDEYSYNGQIYMIKITPEKGEPYFFMDLDGDGKLERDERSRAFQPVEPVHWKIKEW